MIEKCEHGLDYEHYLDPDTDRRICHPPNCSACNPPPTEVELLRAEVERLTTQLADLEKVKAERDQLVEDYVPMVGNDFFNVHDGVVDLTMKGARKIVANMAQSMSMMLDDAKAENYVEIDAISVEGGKFTMRLQRGGKPTPHDLRVQADERAKAAEGRAEAAEKQLAEARTAIQEQLAADQKSQLGTLYSGAANYWLGRVEAGNEALDALSTTVAAGVTGKQENE